MDPVTFHNEDIEFMPENLSIIQYWIAQTIREYNKTTGEINIIFCSDEYLYNINEQYLNHDDYTDIITFNNADNDSTIEGDIFISVERVIENASIFSMNFESELHRVIIHGILHLLGYTDKSDESKAIMTKKEDACLEILSNLSVPRGT
ncbi:MAG: rRNA maturation RNase YbeY [Cyclobacteriaceae bacterium]|nr:rRNA maturation RNase YbeY [Cyclobacteriaceae bacterium]